MVSIGCPIQVKHQGTFILFGKLSPLLAKKADFLLLLENSSLITQGTDRKGNIDQTIGVGTERERHFFFWQKKREQVEVYDFSGQPIEGKRI